MQALAGVAATTRIGGQSMVTRSPGLHLSRRGDNVLVVEPLTASWGVFSAGPWKLFQAASKPQSAAAFVRRGVA